MKRLTDSKPPAAVLAEAGRALLAADAYALAKSLLQQAAAAAPTDADLQLSLAMAVFRADGTQAGLRQLDRLGAANQNAAVSLARAQMLAAAGDHAGAGKAISRALGGSASAEENRAAVAVLVGEDDAPAAFQRAREAAAKFADDREILLLQATTLEFAHRSQESDRRLAELEQRWPEWPVVWMEHGMLLAGRGTCQEASRDLQSAIALGAQNAAAYYYLADCALRSATPALDVAKAAIADARKIAPHDESIQALATQVTAGRPAPAAQAPPYLKKLFAGSYLDGAQAAKGVNWN